MNRIRYILFLLVSVCLLNPGFALAQRQSLQDIVLLQNDISFDQSIESIEADTTVMIDLAVENTSDQETDVLVELFLDNESELTKELSIDENSIKKNTIIWQSPDESVEGVLRFEVTALDFSDIDTKNNVTEIPITIIKPTVIEKTVDVKDKAEQALLPEEVGIHVQQLGWDTFSFRPTHRIGAVGLSYIWDFGNGSTTTEQRTEYSYDKSGIYTVSLQVIDEDGQARYANVLVRVGFFHLANWRLWGIILLLLVGIVLSLLILKSSDKIHHSTEHNHGSVKDLLSNVKEFESDAEGIDDFDLIAATGMDKDHLKKELQILEELHTMAEKKRSAEVKKKPKKRKKTTTAKKKTTKSKTKTSTKKTKTTKKTTKKKKK